MLIFSPYAFELIFPVRKAEGIQTRNWSPMDEWAPILIGTLLVQCAKDCEKGNTRLRRKVIN